MLKPSFPSIERNIARCRLVLSVVALLAIYVDPTESLLVPWTSPRGHWFAIDSYTLTTMGLHLAYSIAVYYAVARQLLSVSSLVSITTWGDVLFSAAIAFFTEGVSSPFYAFFAFAVVGVGLRSGFRRTMFVTGVTLGLYLSLIVVSGPAIENFYIMRPVYLAIIAYLVGYMGQQRLNLEAEIHALAAADQRSRIARDLHDGWAQALAGINLRIESCRQLLARGRADQVLADLGELQGSVHREYDDLRTYMRSLAGLESTETVSASQPEARFSVSAEFAGSARLVDHVLQILREGTSNVLRHARAQSAELRVRMEDGRVTITIDDDGVGFEGHEQRPWSISSRVRELGGDLRVVRDSRRGAHLTIDLPEI